MTDTTTIEPRIPEIFVADWKTEPGRNGVSQLDLFWQLVDRWFDGSEEAVQAQFPDVDPTETWILDRLKRYQDDLFELRDAQMAEKMQGKAARQRALKFLVKLAETAQNAGKSTLASAAFATIDDPEADRLAVNNRTQWLKDRLAAYGIEIPRSDEEQLVAEGMDLTEDDVLATLVDEDSVPEVAKDF